MSTTTHQGAEGAETKTAGPGDLLYRSEWETARTITHEEAHEIARRLIASHFHRTDCETARASIPANPDRDDDLLINSYIKQQARKEAVTPAPRTDGGMTAGEDRAWPFERTRTYLLAELERLRADLHTIGADLTGEQGKAASWLDVATGRVANVSSVLASATPAQPAGAVPDSLRALSEAATAGPFSVSGVRKRYDEASCVIVDAPSCGGLFAFATAEGREALTALADAKFVVAAANHVRDAIAACISASEQAVDDRREIEQLEHELDVAKQERDAAFDRADAAERNAGTEAGWVVANALEGAEQRFRRWGQVGPEWTADRDAALWFARRSDAEAFAAEDEDAWRILPVSALASHPAGQSAETDALVDRFAVALKAKLRAAEAKYGWQNGWLKSDWQVECRNGLLLHVGKGDPLDVAAYAAFCWHHGWSTSSQRSTEFVTGAVEPTAAAIAAYTARYPDGALSETCDHAIECWNRVAVAACLAGQGTGQGADPVETVARALYEHNNRGLRDVWAWDADGLEEEHPGTRERYERQAAAALKAIGAEETEDDLDRRIARTGARENMQLIDGIADLIGLPHDVELQVSHVREALAKPAPDSPLTGPVGVPDIVRSAVANAVAADGFANGPAAKHYAALRALDWVETLIAARPAAPEAQGWRERVRHVKCGTEYEVLGEAEAQIATQDHQSAKVCGEGRRILREGQTLTVYRGSDGKLWCRFTDEMRDGRFETITPPSDPAPSGQAEG